MGSPTQSSGSTGRSAAAPLRVRLIGKANGVGLSRDFDLLAGALRACGCSVTLRGCEKPDRKRRRNVLTRLRAHLRELQGRFGARHSASYDVNLMLEHVWPQFLHEAACNVLVPNPEWFDRRDLAFLGSADVVWAKTAHAERIFATRGRSAVRIGFDSEDRYDPDVPRLAQFMHLAGRSPLKGTERLRALWLRHPEWPMLTIVQDATDGAASGPAVPLSEAENITAYRGYLEDATLRRLQNSHRFHVCTSEAEGWGHYIAEAMSVAAVTVTCDAPPMNELVTAERGVLVAVHEDGPHNLATLCRFDDSALEAAVERVMGMSAGQWDALGAAARRWFLDNKQGFTARVGRAVAELPHP